MRIVIDIDGTISELRKEGQTYADVKINKGAAEKIRKLKKDGHYIILHSARHMKTCKGNVEKVRQKVGKITIEWLKKHGIPYDEIHFGKPYAHLYIDDLGHTFHNWDAIHTEHLNEKNINILIPMAGAGSRFVNAGYKVPKPLIKAKGKTMIEWAMKTFDFVKKVKGGKIQYIFIILESHDKEHKLGAKLKKLFGKNAIVIRIPQVTGGQAETCLAAKDHINTFNRLFIYNCDTYSEAPLLDLIEKEDPDGIISCFKATDPRYSYVKLDAYGYINETAEKKVISDLATTGMYYFKRGADFVRCAEHMIARNERHNNEFYVAPCYNELLRSGKKVKHVLVTKNWVMGTPDELEYFKKHYK